MTAAHYTIRFELKPHIVHITIVHVKVAHITIVHKLYYKILYSMSGLQISLRRFIIFPGQKKEDFSRSLVSKKGSIPRIYVSYNSETQSSID